MHACMRLSARNYRTWACGGGRAGGTTRPKKTVHVYVYITSGMVGGRLLFLFLPIVPSVMKGYGTILAVLVLKGVYRSGSVKYILWILHITADLHDLHYRLSLPPFMHAQYQIYNMKLNLITNLKIYILE